MKAEDRTKEAEKVVANLDWQQSPMRELAYLLGQKAGEAKTALATQDFSRREFAIGKVTGYLVALEDVLELPSQCRANAPAVAKQAAPRKPRKAP